MYLQDVANAIKVCLMADVPVAQTGHKGIGKTEVVKDIATNWEDPYTGKKGLICVALYCATQEVTDLIGFPIKVWEKSGNAVVEGIKEEGRIITKWAPPEWWSKFYISPEEDAADKKYMEKMKEEGASEEEIMAFWNRPRFVVFLDEFKRAQRDVMQAMYPFVLSKTLHMYTAPRGTRVVIADNFAGAYDVREPDEALMSRFCHLEVEPNINSWHHWAVNHGISSKLINFLTSNPAFLMSVPQEMEKASISYKANPDPRAWTMIDRIEKFGRKAIAKLVPEVQSHIIHQVIVGIVGLAAAGHYREFSDTLVSFEDILAGKASVKKVLENLDKIEAEKYKEKLLIETSAILENAKYSEARSKNFRKFLIELDAKEKATAILQNVFTLKNQNQLEQKWVEDLIGDPAVMELINHLMAKNDPKGGQK